MIGIICALSSEIGKFFEVLVEKKEIKILNYSFFTGIINNHSVVIVKSGIGKVQAGICTALMVEHFKPELVINSGIAGGFDKSLKTLDSIFVLKVGCYDMDLTIDGLPYGCFEKENRFFSTKIQAPIDAIPGIIMTADKFAGNRLELEEVFNKYYSDVSITCVDMESYAIVSVLEQNHINWIILRTISDLVGESDQIQNYYNFPELASEKSFNIIVSNYLK